LTDYDIKRNTPASCSWLLFVDLLYNENLYMWRVLVVVVLGIQCRVADRPKYKNWIENECY